MMGHHEIGLNHFSNVPQLILLLLFCMLFVLYISAMTYTNRFYKTWPMYRTICWVCGIFFAATAVVSPLASFAHTNFIAHMVSHLLLGMLGPLFIAIASPITLLLRTLNTRLARRLSKLLKSWPSRIVSDPGVAAFLNIGGLWLLYTTDMYSLMHENHFIYFIVHVHVFLAGYLFTISLIYFDPVFHRNSFLYRAIILIIALAGHGILAKYLYAHPPNGVPLEQAEFGSMVMYYGGDVIDALLIFILCLQWYRATRPRVVRDFLV